jgi:hypothetical protein
VALTDDQKALLRLLAQREQGYEDIGALMGLSVGQVRERVREALAALNEAEEAREPAPTPRAAEPPPPPPPPPTPAATEPSAASQELHGQRPKPQAPRKAPRPGSAAKTAGRFPAGRRRISLPSDGRRRFELAGGALIVILLVLFATGLVDIGGGGGSSSSTSSGKATTGAAGSGKKQPPTQAVLSAVGNGSAEGVAIFGRSGEAVLLLVAARNLEPSPKGQAYSISLVKSPSERIPIAATEVNRSGRIAGRFQVAPEVLGLLAGGFDQMEVSLVSNAALKAALANATKERKAPSYGGKPVLRGQVTGPFIKK